MKVYIITHKEFDFVTKTDLYVPLLVGADNNKVASYKLKDNLYEDNISAKNSSFCELTGMYWIWKHSDEDIVGINHYRRYFSKNRFFNRRSGILDRNTIVNDLQNYDIIATLKGTGETLNYKAGEYFKMKHDPLVWEQCKKIIEKDYSEYLPAFDWYEQQTNSYVCNMLIMNKDLYDSYCEWLFGILFKLDNMIDYSKYDNYNSRMIGFVSERLQNVWIKKHNLRVKEYPIYFTEDTFTKRILRRFLQ